MATNIKNLSLQEDTINDIANIPIVFLLSKKKIYATVSYNHDSRDKHVYLLSIRYFRILFFN